MLSGNICFKTSKKQSLKEQDRVRQGCTKNPVGVASPLDTTTSAIGFYGLDVPRVI